MLESEQEFLPTPEEPGSITSLEVGFGRTRVRAHADALYFDDVMSKAVLALLSIAGLSTTALSSGLAHTRGSNDSDVQIPNIDLCDEIS